MGLSRAFEQTTVERLQLDPVFAQTLFDQALTLMFTGEAASGAFGPARPDPGDARLRSAG